MTEVISRISCDESSSHARPPSHGVMSTPSATDSAATLSKQLDFGEISKTPLSSATESKIPKRSTSTSSTQSKNNSMRSPRCEAFLMTGDKMLNLNAKISPHYAKVYQEQLPPSVEVYDGNSKKSFESTKKKCGGPFDDFPSMHHPARRSGVINARDGVEGDYSTSSNYIVHDADEFLMDDNDVNLATTSKFSANEDATKNNCSIKYSNNDGTVPSTRPCETAVVSPSAACHIASSSPTSSPTRNNSCTQSGEKNESASAGCCRRLVGVEGATDRRLCTTLSREESTVSSRSVGLEQTLPSGLPKPATISRIVIQMFTLQAGFSPTYVATNLMKKDELSEQIAAEFLQHFHFSGKRIDAALREFLNHVCLTGESSERAHLLLRFSTRYYECNPTLFSNIDEIHALACALILLNTDLHGPNLGKKMTMREFVDNLLHTRCAYDRNMLKTLYNAVKDSPFKREALQRATSDTTVTALKESGFVSMPERGKKVMNGGGVSSAFSLHDPMAPSSLTMVDPNEQVDYRHGWVLKKSTYDSDGVRTPFGRRKWQMCYATIRGMVLYLHKNEKVFETSRRHETFANCIRLHHAVAEVADDYTKRPHVFRLRSANLGELLFQTSDEAEVQKWIDAINYVAAVFSTPVLPVPVSSADAERGTNKSAAFMALCALHRQLPVAPTSLSITEQLRSHRERLEEVTDVLAKLRSVAPPISAKGKAVYEYFYRERLMDKERERYSIYISILNEKLGIGNDATVENGGSADRCVGGRGPFISSSSSTAATPSKSGAFTGNAAAADSQSMTSCSTALALNNTRVAAAICCQQQPAEAMLPGCCPSLSTTTCCHRQKSVESGSCGGVSSVFHHHHHHLPVTSQLKHHCIHSLHCHQQQCCLAAGKHPLAFPAHHHLPKSHFCCGGGAATTCVDGVVDTATASASNAMSQATPSESVDNLPTPSYCSGCCCYNNYSHNTIGATNMSCATCANAAGGTGGRCCAATATVAANPTAATERPVSDVEQHPPLLFDFSKNTTGGAH